MTPITCERHFHRVNRLLMTLKHHQQAIEERRLHRGESDAVAMSPRVAWVADGSERRSAIATTASDRSADDVELDPVDQRVLGDRSGVSRALAQ